MNSLFEKLPKALKSTFRLPTEVRHALIYAIVTDGTFTEDDSFHIAPGFMAENLEAAFQHEVLKMLKKEGKINSVAVLLGVAGARPIPPGKFSTRWRL